MIIKFSGGAYQDPYLRFSAQRCINWYPHKIAAVEVINPQTQEDPGRMGYLKPTPGLKSFVSVSANRIRGIFSQNDRCFFVASNVLYEIIGDNVSTLGTMTNFSTDDDQKVFIIQNGNSELGIFGGATAYTYNLGTSTLAQITDVDFPGAESAEYMDGYGIVTYNGRAYFSQLNDFTSWVGSDVFTPTYEADLLIAVLKLKGAIWCFGNSTIEPYYNDGVTPFSRTPQASVDVGCYSAATAAKFTDSIIFLGRSNRGSLAVYMLDLSTKADIISPGSIITQLNKDSSALQSAYAFTEETKDGHQFYHLTIPDMGKTFSYDRITNEWHERSSRAPFDTGIGEPIHAQWRANCFAEYRGKYLVGDFYSGNVFELDADTMNENGVAIRRERTAGTYTKEQKLISVSDITFDCSTGITVTAAPTLQFSASRDGGYNYSQERNITLPIKGGYGNRVKINKLGRSRNWAVKVVLTDEVNLAIFDAFVHGAVGTR